ncbi:MAG: polyphenol oxidase family protein [Deltaproteobacteria bacterium]|nr:polyphenol oxidase family protein [Deltaproteobacteria bacterium]
MLRAAYLAAYPHGFTGRDHGDFAPPSSAPARLLATLALPGPYAAASQVHGNRLASVPFEAEVPEADAVLTRLPGSCVAVRVADCVPILLAAPGAVAAVHAGWRGTAADIVRHAVQALGAGEGLRAAIGPCIRGCCYEVGEEVIDRVAAVAPGRAWLSARHVDLAVANAAILAELGVATEIVGPCTRCDPQYWSHRRDGASAGRQVGAIGLPP